MEDQQPQRRDDFTCPQCGVPAVALITPPSAERSSVVWCEAGHVTVMVGAWVKGVFDFKGYPEHEKLAYGAPDIDPYDEMAQATKDMPPEVAKKEWKEFEKNYRRRYYDENYGEV